MFGIGGFEFFLILIFGFLIVGPDRLPAMAKTIGQAISKFRGAQEEMNKVIKTEVYDPDSKDPFKNPLEVLEKAGSSSKSMSGSKAAAAKASEPKTTSGSSASGDRRESFSERKARYEKERAAKKAADAEKEAAEKRAANAVKDAAPAKAAPAAKTEPAAAKTESAESADAAPATEEKGE